MQPFHFASRCNFSQKIAFLLTPQNKKEEDYVPPAYRAFSGSGAALGKAASAPKTAIVSGSGGAAVVVDDSQPTTTLQIRLADGRREKVVLNLSHTIADLQKHVAS